MTICYITHRLLKNLKFMHSDYAAKILLMQNNPTISTHTHAHTHWHTCTHTHTHTCTHAHTHIHALTHMHTHTHCRSVVARQAHSNHTQSILRTRTRPQRSIRMPAMRRDKVCSDPHWDPSLPRPTPSHSRMSPGENPQVLLQQCLRAFMLKWLSPNYFHDNMTL